MANFAKSGHTETSFWERNFFWWNLNDCIFPIKIAAEILKMKIRETFNFQKTRNQNLKYAPNWNPFWGHHLEGLKSFFFSSASAKSMHKVLMSFRVLICSLSLSLSLIPSHTVDLFIWRSLLLWIVATRWTEMFQFTDTVFQIDHVYISTMNIL